MKKYEKPEIKTVKFEVKDVIAASGFFAKFDGFGVSFPGSWIDTTVDGGTANFHEDWTN